MARIPVRAIEMQRSVDAAEEQERERLEAEELKARMELEVAVEEAGQVAEEPKEEVLETKCPECGFVAQNLAGLKAHMRKHTEEE